MTNPDNVIGTNAAYSGRTSANAFNDGLAAYTRGILTGWVCSPSSGLTVSLGGDGTTRDVAIAEDNAGNKTTINNRLGASVEVTVAAAPGSSSRIDAIVAYVDNPPQGTSTVAGNPAACGIISVTGTAASSPTTPTDSQIRSAITADGASGTTAYYVILSTVTIATGTTDLTASDIEQGAQSTISNNQINYSTLKLWMPDYAQKGSTNLLSSDNSTTFTDTGFVYYECLVYKDDSTSPHIDVRLNGYIFNAADGAKDLNNNLVAQVRGLVPVAAGDTLAVSYSSGSLVSKRNAFFVPGRWV